MCDNLINDTCHTIKDKKIIKKYLINKIILYENKKMYGVTRVTLWNT